MEKRYKESEVLWAMAAIALLALVLWLIPRMPS